MNRRLKGEIKPRNVFKIIKHGSIPLAIIAASGVIALFSADRWILDILAKQRDLNFRQEISRISLQLSESVLLSNYNNIDTLLLRILNEDLNITCLAVSDNNSKILSIASREQPGSNASIKYGQPPKNCNTTTEKSQDDNFYASSLIENNKISIGSVRGHAVKDENDVALIRSIELILFGAFGAAFLPAFGVLSWSSNRQLELEQEKTTRVSALISQLREAQSRTRAAFEGTNDGWIEWNVQTNTCIPSLKMQQLIGLTTQPQRLKQQTYDIKKSWKQLVTKKDRRKLNLFLERFRREKWEADSDEGSRIEIQLKPLNSRKALTLKIDAVATEIIGNQVSVVALVANNITQDKEQKERINNLAFHDTLTNLHNRLSFGEELKNAEYDLKNNKYRLAIFAIDIDNFKFLNDSYGHTTGDEFLVEVANRLKSCTREIDFVARLGGDEFVIIYRLPNTSSGKINALVRKIAENLLGELSSAYHLKNCTAFNTCSIGICVDNIDSKSESTLLDKADIALYKAKDMGRNCFFIYKTGMASEVIEKAATTENLKEAIEAGEGSLTFQPIVRLNNSKESKDNDEKVIGYEALFRCPSLDRSIQQLISYAEEAGMINLITESILDGIGKRLHNIDDWEKTYISINISPIQFLGINFPATFINQLRKRKIDPRIICIEITETAVMRDIACALKHMNCLKEKGVRFSLDDFGTGYASIELLRKLPFTSIKVDRTYIQNIHLDSGIQLVKCIIDMAKVFNMELIGEGVETAEQKNSLALLGCEYAQGFLFDENGNERKSSI